ncbi:TPA: hypothetical protein DEW47_01905 [Patescibacteria group bacterium]|nr:MAG: hypothetical protein UT71_C0002G0067 [Parcubacteria group bacterium GW2011_GWF2_40_10]KKR47844.1 MAG: hypothetical protein UT83_C0003G0057 [Parcubacteria group bacterium GW2011_GWA2_40_143]KKR60275.1 MAG: hypothetical protein UT97_C0003G0057 [Parcubacteria group bacterium GW2011_GWC2_40_31]KKR75229.1 MAG: hypothetical protein UU18_C0010G0005 [Parcubacteria group bacterium GW2011_GWB2_40_8]KKR77436.1 MAG: hypothetical protein UU20_C0007G0006 [Parcubacteria group bacterium GW2011_GWE2_40_
MQNQPKKDRVLVKRIFVSVVILFGVWVYATGQKTVNQDQSDIKVATEKEHTSLEEKVLPSDGIILPVNWGDLGSKLVNVGAIDADKFKAIYEQRGTFTDEYEKLLFGQSDGKLKITKENSGYLLNLFWALGLASKNDILENGEMMNLAYGGAGRFASTGGWTLAKGDAMDHYSKHKFFNLTPEQQAMVDKVSRGIYRPCCGNSTHFPDCNHGMAMLGLLQLMASQGVSEQEMWKTALQVNSYWFPETYMTLAAYFERKGTAWDKIDPQLALGNEYSSASGYQRVLQEIEPADLQGGGGCGV